MEKEGIVILTEWTEFISGIKGISRKLAFLEAITYFGFEGKEPKGLSADEQEYFEKRVRPYLEWQREKNLKVTPEEMEEYLWHSKGR